MSSVRNFKKELNQVLSELIEECYACQLTGDDKVYAKGEKIIDEAIQTFDDIIEKMHAETDLSPKEHFKSLRKELEDRSLQLTKQIDKLKA